MKSIIKKIKRGFGGFFRSLAEKRKILKSLAIIAGLSAFLILFQIAAQNFNLLQLRGPVLYNFLPIFLVMCLLYFIIGKVSLAFAVTNVIFSLMHIVHHYKTVFRDEPLKPSDFKVIKEAQNIVQGYDLTPDFTVWMIIAVCVLSVVLALVFIKNKRPNAVQSIIGIVLTVAVMIGANNEIYASGKAYVNFFVSEEIYRETEIVSAKGLVYSLVTELNVNKYEVPEGYSEKEVKKLLSQYADTGANTKENTPNVIVVMMEAYTDMQDWENVKFDAQNNPYEFFNSIRKSGCSGKILIPGFGGGTSSSEFEMLTGCNTYAISTSIPVAYNTIITQNADSVVRVFKNMGYDAHAIHPGFAWFYNRQNVYPRLGFDSFLSKEQLPADVECVNHYVADSVTSELIINDYKEHLETSPDRGYFNFTVTIQNHGPYNSTELLGGKEYISNENLTPEEYYIINNYIGGVADADALMKELYEYVNTIDEPTVLLFFGDHLPYLDAGEQIYQKMGLDIASQTMEAYETRYTTDYVMIGNSAYLQNSTPAISGDQGTISANYLSVKLMQYMNMELPPYYAFLNDMMQTAPIISRQHNIGNVEYEEKLKEYKILMYHNLCKYKEK